MRREISLRETVVITGAFSYTGKYATRLMLDRGMRVRTLTNHPERANPFGDQVGVFPFNFDHPELLVESLCGASTLINTYWVRFPRGRATFETAIQNTRTLIDAAVKAGVRNIVHVSIANPSLDSPLAYYRGKAQLEEAVKTSGLSYAILRPTVIFGVEDILINNIAWFVRRFPVFGIPGDGSYKIRPIYVEDMAQLIVADLDQRDDCVIDAVGPETFTFDELVKLIAAGVNRRVRLLHLSPALAYAATKITGWFVRDVVLTKEECKGLMSNLLAPDGPATGATLLSKWLEDHSTEIGVRYASEVARHFK